MIGTGSFFNGEIDNYRELRAELEDDGHTCETETVLEGRAIQLLTHPVWRCGYDGEEPVETIDRFVFNSADRFRSEQARQCTFHRKEVMRNLVSGSD